MNLKLFLAAFCGVPLNAFPVGGGPLPGVNLSTVYDTLADLPCKTGTVVRDDLGGQWELCEAGADVSQYDAVIIAGSNTMYKASISSRTISHKIGFAQANIASGKFGWVQRSGRNVRVNAAANCAPGAQLYLTATGGVVDDAIVSNAALIGVVSTDSISNATAINIIVPAEAHIGFDPGQ